MANPEGIIEVALRAYLLAQTDIRDLTTKIYCAGLEREDYPDNPQKIILLEPSGGIDQQVFQRLYASPRIDIYSYGESLLEARKLDNAVYMVLRELDRTEFEEVILLGAQMSGGPFVNWDEQTGWPLAWRSAVITATIDP